MTSLNKEMLMKIGAKDILGLIDKKANNDEVQLDLTYLKNTLQKSVKEFKVQRDEQSQLNEALCSENCVARYLWKHGSLD